MSNIKVAVRLRPPIEREINSGEKAIWKAHGNTIYMESGKINSLHTFDHVFDSTSTNLEVYQKYCHPIVESVMLGFNGTIFAFGQTSSGKTHTMMGNSSQPGLIPLAINAIFDIIQNVPEREYLLRVSYMEIYNENILDLLDNGDGKHLQIRDNVDGQPVIVDLTEVPVGSKEEIESAMNNGERRRHVASTEANQRSSRSHSIFRMVIESSLRDGTDGAVAIGQLNLVDLAGSERTEQCGDLGERFRESTRINVSLTFLTQVISKLSRGERGHINFRDSKLTRILRNSLGGNAHTAIVCTVNPCCLEQTLRTLQFASSAKKIQNTPKVNEIVTNDAQIRRYHMQIEELKGKVRDLEGSTLTKTLQEKNSQIDELKNQVRSLEKKLLVSTLPQCRKQRRETWAAPRRIDSSSGAPLPSLPFLRAVPASKAVESPEVFEERGRLSTVMEESESSFHAISYDDFEKQLQREERIRRSAVLHSTDNTLGSLSACSNTMCAERIAFLENELSIVRKEYKELEEMTRLERLMCTTSRRPASSDKLGEAESAAPILPSESTQKSPLLISAEKTDWAQSTPISRLNECCVQTLLASRKNLPCASRISGAFFSPLAVSSALAEHDDSSKASLPTTSPEGCQKRESTQGSSLHTPRTVLWSSHYSPAACIDNTPASLSETRQGVNQKVSKPLCSAQATQTDDMQCLQAPWHIQTLSIKTEDSGMLQQVQAPTVDTMCQTDSEDVGEASRPLMIELSGNNAAVHLNDSTLDVNYHKRTLTKSSEIQTSDLCCNIVEGQLGRPELTDAAISCHLYFEQLVECHVQTEPFATVCSAMEVAKQEAECVFTGVGDQVSPVKICSVQSCGVQTFVDAKDHESQVNTSLADNYRADFGTQAVMAMPSGTCCGVQAIPDVEDYASQVSTSFAEGYRTDFGVQAMAEVLNHASQVDVQFTRNGATDCAVQCELLAPDDDIETPAPNAVDCEVQATLLVQECATQTEQCLLYCDLRDSDVQVAPSMRDSAVQVEQTSRSSMLHCSVQTTLQSFCDSSTQPECQVPRAVGVPCEVQAVPVTRSCASQVNASLTSQVTPVSKSASTPFATGGSSQFRMFSVKSILADRPENSMPLDASASSSASGSARRRQFGHPGGDILAALQASQHKFVKDEEGGGFSSSGHQKVVDHTSPAPSIPALGRKTWLQQSKMVRVSVAVQVDIWSVQEMQELHQERSSMQLRMEKYKKASQDWESQYKLREKAAKKREIELHAIIRQLKNKDADTSVVAACGSGVAAATSAGGEALRKPGAPAKPLATESSASLAQQLKAMTPRSREGARLVYFGRSLKEQAIAEEVQVAQLRASAASKTQRLASAERRHRAWAELSSHTGTAEPRSPLKEANQKSHSSAESAKEEILDDMAYWPPMKFFMDDKENEESP
ncbi:uncharacterized protein [Dermacentor andersoni]|uniref:uncharacterized protein n=1 Tax=Dermacentor andersoni TaxID=34620 RepID=UPI002155A331|nr:uncharacterized protein LOC126540031 [Dermacentor andersoni]